MQIGKIIIVSIALLTAGIFSDYANVMAADTGATPSGIGALGRIEPRSRIVKLSHDAGPEGARIETLNVTEGQKVKKGDVIAVYSDYMRKSAKLDSARSRIAVIEANSRVEAANEQFYALDDKRSAELIKSSAIPQKTRDESRKNYEQTKAKLLSLAAELKQAKSDASLAEKELAQSTLTSPMDGTVLKINARPGERVSDNGVITLADLSQLDVVAEIYERDMPRIKVGQKAEIMIPGVSGVTAGEVRELGYEVRKNDMNNTDPLSDRDNRVIEVRITLASDAVAQLEHLLLMQVQVRIL
jgi:HlyD family secretion protein